MLIAVWPHEEAHDRRDQGLDQSVPLDVAGRRLFDANFECWVLLDKIRASQAVDPILVHAHSLHYIKWISVLFTLTYLINKVLSCDVQHGKGQCIHEAERLNGYISYCWYEPTHGPTFVQFCFNQLAVITVGKLNFDMIILLSCEWFHKRGVLFTLLAYFILINDHN